MKTMARPNKHKIPCVCRHPKCHNIKYLPPSLARRFSYCSKYCQNHHYNNYFNISNKWKGKIWKSCELSSCQNGWWTWPSLIENKKYCCKLHRQYAKGIITEEEFVKAQRKENENKTKQSELLKFLNLRSKT